MKKILIFLLGLAVTLQSFNLKAMDDTETCLMDTMAYAEAGTAVLRGCASYYSQKAVNELGKGDKRTRNRKAFLALARLANDGLSLFHYLKLRNKNFQDQYTTSGKLDKDNYFKYAYSLSWMTQDLASIESELFHKEKPKNDSKNRDASTTEDQKISDFARSILTYVLPAVEGFAATARARDSITITNCKDVASEDAVNTDIFTQLNKLSPDYWCSATISICRLLEEVLEQDKTNIKKIWMISQTVIFAAVILLDIVPEWRELGETNIKSLMVKKALPKFNLNLCKNDNGYSDDENVNTEFNTTIRYNGADIGTIKVTPNITNKQLRVAIASQLNINADRVKLHAGQMYEKDTKTQPLADWFKTQKKTSVLAKSDLGEWAKEHPLTIRVVLSQQK